MSRERPKSGSVQTERLEAEKQQISKVCSHVYGSIVQCYYISAFALSQLKLACISDHDFVTFIQLNRRKLQSSLNGLHASYFFEAVRTLAAEGREGTSFSGGSCSGLEDLNLLSSFTFACLVQFHGRGFVCYTCMNF